MMRIRLVYCFLPVLLLTIVSFVPFSRTVLQVPDNQLTDQQKKEGWVLLFDGKTINAWRTYQNKADDSWDVQHGELYCKKDPVTNRADLITKETYASFELLVDWKVSPKANSGILYHVLETHDNSYETGPEYQLIDDTGYGAELEKWQKSGADYAMHPPLHMAAKPVGQYNHTRLLVNGEHVEQWLNGVKTADFHAWTPEWQRLKSTGKWKDHPDYGVSKTGFIALQDHGGGIWFKNLKIRKL